MLGTNDLHRLTVLAETQRWRLVLVGDPRQLQAVGRGGMFGELATNSRTHQLETIHRFNHPWEAAASLRLRSGDPTVLDAYEAKGRIVPGSLDHHLKAITRIYADSLATGHSLAVTTTTNEHVLLVNRAIQQHLIRTGAIDPTVGAAGAQGQDIHVGDQIATRANNRQLKTSHGDIVRNRELWTVTAIAAGGDLDARRVGSDDTVTLPASYVAEHVHLGYAATEHGNQSDTRHASLTLVTPTTTGRGLYVAMTRGRETNMAHVITSEPTIDAARSVLEGVIGSDRADIPAVVQRRQLAAQTPTPTTPPVVQPRCTIPDWLTPLQQRVITEFARIETALDAIDARKTSEATKLADADRAFTVARAALTPHAEACQQASSDLTAAQATVTVATANLAEHRFLGRRPAQQQLADAETALAAAKVRVEDASGARYSFLQNFGQAEQRLEAIAASARTRDILDHYEYLPQQHTQAVDLLNALDTWRDWASGRTIHPDRVSSAVETLESPGQHPDRQSLKALAEAIRTRTPELVITRQAPAIELTRRPEVDLGIDL